MADEDEEEMRRKKAARTPRNWTDGRWLRGRPAGARTSTSGGQDDHTDSPNRHQMARRATATRASA